MPGRFAGVRVRLRLDADDGAPPRTLPIDGSELTVLIEALVALANGSDEAGKPAIGLLHRLSAALPLGTLTLVEEPDGFPQDVFDPDLHTPELVVLATAIETEAKVTMIYSDIDAEMTERNVWPVDLTESRHGVMLHAWCELRGDFRQFRVDRVLDLRVADEVYPGGRERLLQRWRESEARRGPG